MGSKCNHMYPYKSEAEADLPDKEEEMICSQSQGRFEGAGHEDCWSDVATSQRTAQLPEAGRGEA